ncbi:MAG: LysM peptidoglycan-binding domain-containing protein [Candidatus Omnitrophota bacterium]
MGKGIMKVAGLLLAVLFISSCSMRSYVQDKGRVDQDMVGNAGCVQGSCPQVDRTGLQQTRRTYVLEIVTGPKKIEAAQSSSTEVSSGAEGSIPARETNFASTRTVSTQTVISQEVAIEPTFVEYKIEEGDTLQKISKKFYGTYQRWTEIYEANRDVLSTPDRIRPGKIIRIPQK